MSTIEKNKEVVQKLFEQSFNQKNLGLIPDLIAADYTGPQGEKGPAGFMTHIGPLLKAFPDARYTIAEILAEGDKVAVSWSLRGTQTGQFGFIPATGKTIVTEGMAIFLLKDGKITGQTIQTDRLGFFQALGLLPADLSTLYKPEK